MAELVALEPVPAQVALVEAGAAQHRGVLVVGGGVLGAGAEEQERLQWLSGLDGGAALDQGVDVGDRPRR